MPTSVACSQPHRRSARALSCLAFAALVACACSGGGSGAGGSGEPSQRPQFGPKVGGQSGVEGEPTPCAQGVSIDIDEPVPGHTYTAADIFDLVAGAQTSTIRWHSVTPPGSGSAEDEDLEIEISDPAQAHHFPGCGRVDLAVTLALRSASGALQLELPATVSAYGLEEQVIEAELSGGELDRWVAAVGDAVEPTGANHFRVRMTVLHGTIAGGLVVEDESRVPSRCELARWPATNPCQRFERFVPDGEPYQDLAPHYLVEAFHEHAATTLTWLDASETRLEVELQASDAGACVLEQSEVCDDNCDGRAQYRVPSRLRLTTDDGKLDVLVPGYVSTTGAEGVWGFLELSTDGPVVAAPDDVHSFDFDGAQPEQRVVVRFSTREGIEGAVLELWTLDANDGITTSVGDGCALNDYAGPLSLVAQGESAAPDR